MSKAVLISIRPEWCDLIVQGRKTIEVRKTRPKLETPFKAYMKVGHIYTLLDVENYIDTQPEATPQEVAGQCWRNSKYDPPTEADADRLGRIIVWGAAVKHVDITYWENAIFHPVDVPFWMPLPVAPEEKAE